MTPNTHRTRGFLALRGCVAALTLRGFSPPFLQTCNVKAISALTHMARRLFCEAIKRTAHPCCPCASTPPPAGNQSATLTHERLLLRPHSGALFSQSHSLFQKNLGDW